MSVTVHFDENRAVRLTEQVVETRSPDTITFAATGTVTMTGELLGAFEGTRLTPTQVSFSVDGSRTVHVDLSNGASLRLDTVDVGVEPPDSDDLVPDADSIGSVTDVGPDPGDANPGAIAFTVEGVIRSVPDEQFAAIAGGTPELRALSFAVEGPVRSDGGAGDGGCGDEVILEFAVLGFGIGIHRNGTIDVGTRGDAFGFGSP